MDPGLFGSELWKPALDKYAEVTGLSVELFSADGRLVLSSAYATPLDALFRAHGFEPGLFAECARRCVTQTADRPAVAVAEGHGLTVVGTSLILEGMIVGAAVAGYALAHFSQVAAVQRWAQAAGVPFEPFWAVVRSQAPVPQRRLMLHGELLQILGDALLRENYRTRQYEDAAVKLKAADAAKDEFLAMVSHELRTPLAPIAGWASVLKHSTDLAQVRRAADAIERNAFMQSRMVDDLLDVSRVARGALRLDFEILELPALVRAAADNFAAEMAAKQIRLEMADAEPLLVEGDAGRLAQVFRNLFSNAVKFTPAGGSIRVALAREAGNARVVVADSGVGIAPEFLPLVFEIFRQQEQSVRRQHQGLGIGLSLVKKLVDLHHGTVGVASPGPGRGTEVTVELPLAAETPALDEAAAGAEPGPADFAGLSILVVEDSDDTRESLKQLLQLRGAAVSVARDGREALDMIPDVAPDLVLCDLRMPRMDGYQFIRELQRTDSPAHPHVVAVSSFASEADRQRTRDAGFVAHLQKPFDDADLVAVIGTALGFKPARLMGNSDIPQGGP